MQPLGNTGITDQSTTITHKDPKDKNKTISTTTTIKSNTGIYQEVAKKKVSFAMNGQMITFFANKKQFKMGKSSDVNNPGKTFFIDNTGVSYIHWRNRHIYYDSESQMPIKLQVGNFTPSSRLWFVLFELGLLQKLHQGASTPPPRKQNTTTTLMIIFIVAFAMGYFVALSFGSTLSPALAHQAVTTISSTVTSTSTTITNTISTTTSRLP